LKHVVSPQPVTHTASQPASTFVPLLRWGDISTRVFVRAVYSFARFYAPNTHAHTQVGMMTCIAEIEGLMGSEFADVGCGRLTNESLAPYTWPALLVCQPAYLYQLYLLN